MKVVLVAALFRAFSGRYPASPLRTPTLARSAPRYRRREESRPRAVGSPAGRLRRIFAMADESGLRIARAGCRIACQIDHAAHEGVEKRSAELEVARSEPTKSAFPTSRFGSRTPRSAVDRALQPPHPRSATGRKHRFAAPVRGSVAPTARPRPRIRCRASNALAPASGAQVLRQRAAPPVRDGSSAATASHRNSA